MIVGKNRTNKRGTGLQARRKQACLLFLRTLPHLKADTCTVSHTELCQWKRGNRVVKAGRRVPMEVDVMAESEEQLSVISPIINPGRRRREDGDGTQASALF